MSDEATWIGGLGVELGYSEIAADTQVTGTVATDLAGLATTVVVAARPILVRFYAPACDCDTVGAQAFWMLLEDGVQIFQTIVNNVSGIQYMPIEINSRRAPAAGQHTYKVQAKASTAAAKAQMFISAYGPASLHVTQL